MEAKRQTIQESHREYLFYSRVRLLLQRMKEEFGGRELEGVKCRKAESGEGFKTPYTGFSARNSALIRKALTDFFISDWHNIARWDGGEEIIVKAVLSAKGTVTGFTVEFAQSTINNL